MGIIFQVVDELSTYSTLGFCAALILLTGMALMSYYQMFSLIDAIVVVTFKQYRSWGQAVSKINDLLIASAVCAVVTIVGGYGICRSGELDHLRPQPEIEHIYFEE